MAMLNIAKLTADILDLLHSTQIDTDATRLLHTLYIMQKKNNNKVFSFRNRYEIIYLQITIVALVHIKS